MPEVDWEAMKYASVLRLHRADGETWILRVNHYWYGTPQTGDIVDGLFYLAKDKNDTLGTPLPLMVELRLPNPEVVGIEILRRLDKENHGSHPEYAYVWPTIDEIYENYEHYKFKPYSV